MKTQKSLARVVGVVGIAVLALASPVRGQKCPEYLGSLVENLWWAAPDRIEVAGPYAYLGGEVFYKPISHTFVNIVDVSDPHGPVLVGTVQELFSGSPKDIGVSLEHLFILIRDDWRGLSTLQIVNVSDPAHPATLSFNRIGDSGSDQMVVVGESVHVAGDDGLWNFDVTDPSNPIEVGFFASPWEVSDLAADGNFVFAALPESGLSIIDVSDPANSVEVGSWESTWEALDLEVRDGFVYVADGTGGLRVIDVTDPTAPVEVGTLETAFEASKVSVMGSYAAVMLGDSGVLILDVSNPGSPEEVSWVATEEPALAATMSGSTVFISEGTEDAADPLFDGPYSTYGRFSVLDLTRPTSPVEVASFGYGSTAMDVEVADGVIYIANGDTGLLVLDQSNPEDPAMEFLDTPGFALGVAIHGGLALVADDHKGVRIVDVSDPENLSEIGFVDTPGQARRVAVSGDLAYVADGDGGLRIIDIAAPAAPFEVGAINTAEPAIDVAVEGDYAYVADGNLRIVDVSDPASPVVVDTSESIRAMAVETRDNVLYLADGDVVDGAVGIYSLLDGGHRPRLFSRFKRRGGVPTDIKVSGHHAYVASTEWTDGSYLDTRPRPAGVEVFDVLDPNFPSWAGDWETRGSYWAVAVSGGHLYVAGWYDGVVILDSRCLTTYWLDIVAHNDGILGSQWRSDVIISHDAEHAVDVEFVLHTKDGEISSDASIFGEAQGVFEDIVGVLGYEGKGALEIRAELPLRVSSRIYNQSESGSQGAYCPAYRISDCLEGSESGWLYGLRQLEDEFRTNITVTNVGEETARADITLFRTDGTELMNYSLWVEPEMVVQDLQPFKTRAGQPNLGWGFAKVQGEGIITSASVIDSRTNDAVMVPMTR